MGGFGGFWGVLGGFGGFWGALGGFGVRFEGVSRCWESLLTRGFGVVSEVSWKCFG